MKNWKKIIVISLTGTLTFLSASPVFAANHTIDHLQYQDEVNNSRAVDWKSWAQNVLWYFAKQASSAFFTKAPIRSITSQRIELTTGTQKYNSGDIGSSSYIDVQAKSGSSVNMDITVKGTTDFLNAFINVIGVSLTNKNGTDVINTTLGNNGMKVYAIDSASKLGTYRARFYTTNSDKWDCGVVLYNYNASRTVENDNIITNDDKTKFYMIPSINHIQNINNRSLKTVYSVDDIYQEYYDRERADFVYMLPSLEIGDIIKVSDNIYSIQYDGQHDRTIFGFFTQFGTAYWPFDGNLMEKYQKGDKISFEFRVVSEYDSPNGIRFENLDYFKAAADKLQNQEIRLNIDEYVRK